MIVVLEELPVSELRFTAMVSLPQNQAFRSCLQLAASSFQLAARGVWAGHFNKHTQSIYTSSRSPSMLAPNIASHK